MRTIIFLWGLAFVSITKAGFEPPVIIDPPNPQAGDMVRVGLFVEFFPPCLLLPRENSIGETYSINMSSNDITVNVLSDNLFVCNPIPFEPAPREYYEIGILAEGNYTLNTQYTSVSGIPVQFIPPFPLPDTFPVQPYGSQLNFTVSGAPIAPRAVDMLSLQSLILIIIMMLCFTHDAIRKI